ncbi:hypothetical protein LTR27_007162 [Elasticomyces elasticus]|nr:hypothetical protein LTR27_007162 [Elasticomyces elasticus]
MTVPRPAPVGATKSVTETELERIEREIAEIEAADREEEIREQGHQERKRLAKAEAAVRKAAAGPDAELKRQENEAEELEIAREKERDARKSTGKRDGPRTTTSLLGSLFAKPTRSRG